MLRSWLYKNDLKLAISVLASLDISRGNAVLINSKMFFYQCVISKTFFTITKARIIALFTITARYNA